MKISILTLFPEMFSGPFNFSIIKRAIDKGKLQISLINIRDFGLGKHRVVDDRPFGGGIGMVLRVDVLDAAIQHVKDPTLTKKEEQVILLDARGKRFHQTIAQELTHFKHVILICGHYEGIDERVRALIDQTISIGDFILTGGELPAMLITDTIGRLVTGVLKESATSFESFSQSLLEYPQYTMPREYHGLSVPEVLVSGNHKLIEEWKHNQAAIITQVNRPDLLEKK